MFKRFFATLILAFAVSAPTFAVEVPIDAKEITLKYGEWVHITFPLEIE